MNVARGVDTKAATSLEDEVLKGYDFKLVWDGAEPYNPENAAIDVRLRTTEGREYTANIVTPKFIEGMFEKNKKTGECATGAYFAMPDMIIVNKINNDNVRRTIEDMIVNKEINKYFSPL